MSSMDDRLNAAGREARSAFDRIAPLAIDVPGQWGRAVTFAMGVSAVVLLIAVPAVLWGGEPVPFGGPGGPGTPGVASTSDPTTSTTTPSTTMAPGAPVLACGFQLPFSVELPDDFDGPVDGPSPDSDPLEHGQLGVHWTGRQGSVEIRWPTDIAYRGDDVEATGTPENVSFILFGTSEGPQVFGDNPHGFPDVDSGTLEGDWAENDCHVAQLIVYGPEGEPAGSVLVVGDPQADPSVLRLAPTLSRPGQSELVVESRTVDVVPDVIPCQGTPDEPTLSGTIAEPIVYPTAAEALRAYVETRDRWPNVGYFEFIEPDGTITYGRPFEPDPMTAPTPDDGLVIAVSVVPRGDGWAVDAWESSGC